MAIKISLEITGLYEPVLERVATLNETTPLEYIENMVFTFLKNQSRGMLQDKFNKKSEAELVTLFGAPGDVDITK